MEGSSFELHLSSCISLAAAPTSVVYQKHLETTWKTEERERGQLEYKCMFLYVILFLFR